MAKKPNIPAPVNPPSSKIVTTQQWSGPLPPPAALQQFDLIIEGGAERIFRMVEQEQAHRIAHDNQALGAEIKDTKRGHLLGALISVVSIAASVFTAYIGVHWSVSVALVGLPIAAMVASITKR